MRRCYSCAWLYHQVVLFKTTVEQNGGFLRSVIAIAIAIANGTDAGLDQRVRTAHAAALARAPVARGPLKTVGHGCRLGFLHTRGSRAWRPFCTPAQCTACAASAQLVHKRHQIRYAWMKPKLCACGKHTIIDTAENEAARIGLARLQLQKTCRFACWFQSILALYLRKRRASHKTCAYETFVR